MPFEIDYIPVGDGERSGDAIVLRFGNLDGPRNEQKVVVIDGGFQKAAENMIEHVGSYYGTSEVDLVISTHPDFDHISGLNTILENMGVKALLMHKPWDHAQEIRGLFRDGRIQANGIGERLEKSLQGASDLEALATRKGIPVYEPFQGDTAIGGALHVLGPSQGFYEDLLPNFRGLPTPVSVVGAFAPAPVRRAAEQAAQWVRDHISLDLLDDDIDSTSAENNTSTIILLTIDGHKILFTGDAGKTALLQAVDYSDGVGVPLTDLRLLDVPHHGSRRNLNSKILKRIQGQSAFISVAKGSDKHPSKRVVNALQKHGMSVYANCNGTLCHHDETRPTRSKWGNAIREPFHDLVEE